MHNLTTKVLEFCEFALLKKADYKPLSSLQLVLCLKVHGRISCHRQHAIHN